MKNGWLRKFSRAEGGATVVEFALVFGPFAMLMFGTLEYGRMLWAREALQSTANAGARCMGVVQLECATGGSYDAGEAMSYVLGQGASLYVSLAESDVTLDRDATCAGVSGFSQVSIDYTFTTALPVLFGSLSAGVPVTATACFPNQT